MKQLFVDRNAAVQDYLIDFKDKGGSYHDAASGEKIGVDEESILFKAVASKSGESRCEADLKALANDMICPILGAMMKDPVKCFESEALESRTFNLSIGSYERSAIERVFDDAQIESRDASAPLTNRLMKTQRVDGNLQLVLQADEDMCQLFISDTFQDNPAVASMLAEFLKVKYMLVLIDGLDEAAESRGFIEECIDRTSCHQSNINLIVMVSTREYTFESSRVCRRLSAFDVVKIQSLDQDQ